jgi:hypothetical protein
MNELQRQAYMDAMGIDSYMPRLLLAGAKPSTLCEMPISALNSTAVDARTQAPQSTLAQPLAGRRGAAAIQALFDEPPQMVARNMTEAVQELVSATVSQQSVPQFSLSIIRAENILLIDEGMQGDAHPAHYRQLLQNILFAVGAGKPNVVVDDFVWPMARNRQIDQSETAARQTLEAFVVKQVEQLGIRYILLMGNMPALYLGQQTASMGEFIQHSRFAPAQLLCTHSIYPLLATPSLKRDVWQHLQPLYQRLKKN